MSPPRNSWPILFSPTWIGGLEVPNRIVMAPMDPSLSDRTGLVDERTVRHYVERARGGAGLLVTGNLACEPAGRASPYQVGIHDDACLPGLSSLARAVHEVDGRIFFQVSHAGRQTLEARAQAVSASAVPCPLTRTLPRALEGEEVLKMVETFARAALRAREAGADGVEFHMAHGYLVCQFLSPYSNLREDEWGGDERGRARFARLIVERTRSLVGPDWPVVCRLSVDERVPGGIEPALALVYARALVEAGATAISASACNYESFRYNMPAYYLPRSTYAHLAAGLREGLGRRVPVVAVGRFGLGDEAEDCLAKGYADLIAMGRALIAEPHLPRLMREGESIRARPCLSCNRCVEAIARGPIACTVNPEAGELPRPTVPARVPSRILVVGAGPAGITAAVEAASRGHHVELVEAAERPGGHAWSASLAPSKEDCGRLAEYLLGRLAASSVLLRLGVTLAPEEVRASDFDRILIAVGAVPREAPSIEGFETHPAVMHPVAALRSRGPWRHVLVLGAGPEGAEVADALARREEAPRVSLVEARRKVGLGLPSSVRLLLEERLLERGVGLYVNRTVLRYASDGILLGDFRGRPAETLPPADLVVLAIGTRPPPAWSALASDPRVRFLGDCGHPASLLEALAEGFRIGRDIDG
jgi:2,4-dienoyl-CoA reductase-like NADH-dependent reductase (Old Yellow Enzyme family)